MYILSYARDTLNTHAPVWSQYLFCALQIYAIARGYS